MMPDLQPPPMEDETMQYGATGRETAALFAVMVVLGLLCALVVVHFAPLARVCT